MSHLKEISRRGLDTYMALEPVQVCDVVCSEASYKRAADAVLLRGELPSEERLAQLSRNDSRVIRKLHDKARFIRCKKILVGRREGQL